MTKDKHIHKLKRLKYKSGNSIFFCALPDCNFKINISLVLGKRSICWRCGEPFIMSEYSMRLAKPHCEKCHKSKGGASEIIVENYQIPTHNQTASTGLWDGDTAKKELSLAERLTRAIHQVAVPEEDEL